ncbi:cell division protein ZapB [Desulfovulcanus sp.]
MDVIAQLSKKIEAVIEANKRLREENQTLIKELEQERQKNAQVMSRINSILKKIEDAHID